MTAAAALKGRLRADLKAAMQSRATDEVRVLRVLIAALDNAEAVPTQGYRPRALGDAGTEVARRQLDDAQVDALLASEIVERELAAADLERSERSGDAAILLREAELIARYRPG